MSIKTILVPLYGDEKELAALETAFVLGKRFGAHVKGLHISPNVSAYGFGPPMAPATVYVEVNEAIKKEQKAQANKAQSQFKKIADKYDVSITNKLEAGQQQATASWHHEIDADVNKTIAHTGRMADLTVISQIITERHESYSSVIVAALFETGRPSMIIPPGEAMPENLGGNIAIAWDGSQRAIHTVAMARPFLKEAEKVRVITVNDEKHEGPLAQDLIIYLQVHNIAADHISVDRRELSTGQAILGEAKKYKTDMLIMGAFGHSRMREMILGGVTDFMLDYADIPLFMSH